MKRGGDVAPVLGSESAGELVRGRRSLRGETFGECSPGVLARGFRPRAEAGALPLVLASAVSPGGGPRRPKEQVGLAGGRQGCPKLAVLVQVRQKPGLPGPGFGARRDPMRPKRWHGGKQVLWALAMCMPWAALAEAPSGPRELSLLSRLATGITCAQAPSLDTVSGSTGVSLLHSEGALQVRTRGGFTWGLEVEGSFATSSIPDGTCGASVGAVKPVRFLRLSPWAGRVWDFPLRGSAASAGAGLRVSFRELGFLGGAVRAWSLDPAIFVSWSKEVENAWISGARLSAGLSGILGPVGAHATGDIRSPTTGTAPSSAFVNAAAGNVLGAGAELRAGVVAAGSSRPVLIAFFYRGEFTTIPNLIWQTSGTGSASAGSIQSHSLGLELSSEL